MVFYRKGIIERENPPTPVNHWLPVLEEEVEVGREDKREGGEAG